MTASCSENPGVRSSILPLPPVSPEPRSVLPVGALSFAGLGLRWGYAKSVPAEMSYSIHGARLPSQNLSGPLRRRILKVQGARLAFRALPKEPNPILPDPLFVPSRAHELDRRVALTGAALKVVAELPVLNG